MSAYEAEPWSDFAVGTAGAAAALAGLLFVAVSINLPVIIAGPRVPGRAAQALILLATPIFLSLSVLIPGQGSVPLGVELIAIAAIVGPALGWLIRPGTRATEQPIGAWIVGSAVPAVVLSASSLLAGVGVLTESLGGLYWVPAAVAVALLGGLLNAWGLLIEIVR